MVGRGGLGKRHWGRGRVAWAYRGHRGLVFVSVMTVKEREAYIYWIEMRMGEGRENIRGIIPCGIPGIPGIPIPGMGNGGGTPPGKPKGGGCTPGFWPSMGFEEDWPSAA